MTFQHLSKKREFLDAGIPYVILGYSVIIAISLSTLRLGPDNVIYGLSQVSYGGLLSTFVFDSWGTVGGLLAIFLFYGIAVYGTIEKRRLEVSMYLLFSTVILGIVAGLLYDRFFDHTFFLGTLLIAAGASTVAEAGMAAVIVLLAVALAKAIRDWRFGKSSSFILKKWVYLDGAFLLLALYWVLYAQPFFVPTTAYNWRGHELAFILGTIATITYAAVRRNEQVWEGQPRQSPVPFTS